MGIPRRGPILRFGQPTVTKMLEGQSPDTPTGMKQILLAFYDIVARLRGGGAGYPFESFLQRVSYLCGKRSLCVYNFLQKLQKKKRPEK